MFKKWSLVCVILLSIALLVTGCGIPQEDYDAVVAERGGAEAKIERMQSDLETARSDLSIVEGELATLQRQVTSLHSELAQAQIAQAVVEEYFGKILFFDNFEDGDTKGWDCQSAPGLPATEGLPVVMENGKHVLQIEAGQYAGAGSKSWGDYTFQTRLKLLQEGVIISFRASDVGTYFLEFNQDGIFVHKEIYKQTEHEFTFLQQSWQPHNPNQWYDLIVEVKGNNIKVCVNGVPAIDYTDSEPLLNGAIAFGGGGNMLIQADNVLVTTGK